MIFRTSFLSAKLNHARFERASFNQGIDFSGACLDHASFRDADFGHQIYFERDFLTAHGRHFHRRRDEVRRAVETPSH